MQVRLIDNSNSMYRKMTNLIVLLAPYGKYILDGDHIFSNNLPTWQPFTYLVTICLDGDYLPDVYINQIVDIC